MDVARRAWASFTLVYMAKSTARAVHSTLKKSSGVGADVEVANISNIQMNVCCRVEFLVRNGFRHSQIIMAILHSACETNGSAMNFIAKLSLHGVEQSLKE